jgi:hypothetical protein
MARCEPDVQLRLTCSVEDLKTVDES